MQRYTHSIDWLQIHVKTPASISPKSGRFSVELQDYQTRHFKEVYEIQFLTPAGSLERCATLACKPHAAFLGGDMGLLKIENKYLYQSELIDFVNDLLREFNFHFHSISRIDLALDFQKFERISPENFIRKFVIGTYLKKHKAKFSVMGQHLAKNVFQYLRFGSKASEMNYYLYNKTQELAENKNKPWISELWEKAGFDLEADTWRLEFSLKSSCRDLVNIETGEVSPMKGMEILQADAAFRLFKVLFKKYFCFVRNRQGVERKDRMTEVELLILDKPPVIIMRVSDKLESNRMDKIVIRRMEAHNREMRQIDKNYYFYGARLLMEFIKKRSLLKWYMERFPDGTADLAVIGKYAGVHHDTFTQGEIFD